MSERLKIALQKSGRLLEDSLKLLKECGISINNGKNQLKVSANNFPLDIYYLRNKDIPQYIEDGVADVGIIGENTAIESNKKIYSILPLGFSKCRLSIAIPKDVNFDSDYLNGKKIATSYPHTLTNFLKEKNISAEVHEISGSVEIAPNIGLADAICDLVSTGSTLFQNGLVETEVILQSQAHLMGAARISPGVQNILDKLIFRIKSVLTAKSNKYLLLNAPNEQVDQILSLLPGMKSPTVLPLAMSGWSSIHTVVKEETFWEIIDALRKHGAEGILVVPIEKMIL